LDLGQEAEKDGFSKDQATLKKTGDSFRNE